MKKFILILILVFSAKFSFASSQSATLEIQKIDTLWFAWPGYDMQNIEIFCKKWDKSDWLPSHQLTEKPTNGFTPAIALDKNNNPWIVWAGTDGIKTSIFCSHYDGKKWSSPSQVDDVDIYSDSMPSITIDENGIPWVAWTGSDGIDDDIYVTHLQGKNWAIPVMVNTDNTTPDVMPIISIDEQKKIIIVWCGFEGDKYKLFFSQKNNNKWTEQKPVVKTGAGFSVDLPNIIKNKNGNLELFWYEKNICYKSSWYGIDWSNPELSEILLPDDIYKTYAIGPAYIAWVQDGIHQSLRIDFPQKKLKIAGSKYSNNKETFSLLSDFLCTTAYAEVELNKYIAFGDSITWGVGATDISPFNPYGYPPRLEEKLIARIGPSTVVNEGSPGERTFQGLMRIDDVLSTYNAQFILIMEGTNDITYQSSTETITFNLGKICENSREYGTTPLLATLTPRMDFLNDRIKDDVNPAITELAEFNSFILVDQYTEMAEDTASYMSDGRLHPNDAGYELMAETWYTTIYNILYPPEPEPDENSGCGSIAPTYKNKNNFYNNLLPLFFLFLILLLTRKFQYFN